MLVASLDPVVAIASDRMEAFHIQDGIPTPSKMRSMVVKPGGRRRAPLMHEESGDHYQYRQYAKANHCNSKPNVRQKPLPLHQ